MNFFQFQILDEKKAQKNKKTIQLQIDNAIIFIFCFFE